MVKFHTIASVRKDIERYKANKSYTNCCKDLCGFFNGKNIDEIFNSPRRLRENDKIRYIKSRICNSNNNRGARCGYRVYYYVDFEKKTVTIVRFYPKIGPFKHGNMGAAEEKNVIAEYRKERDALEFVEHNVVKDFAMLEA